MKTEIEPGCLAIIINRHPEDNGKCVRVIRKLTQNERKTQRIGVRNSEDYWEIDQEIRIFYHNILEISHMGILIDRLEQRHYVEETFNCAPAHCLLRIDSDEGEKVEESKKLEETL